MALTRWNPFREMEELLGRSGRGLTAHLGDDEWLPAVDISENDKEYLIKAELPGIDKKDIEVSVQDNVLTLAGERRSEETDEKRHRVERYQGRFALSFTLPVDADADKIRAKPRTACC